MAFLPLPQGHGSLRPTPRHGFTAGTLSGTGSPGTTGGPECHPRRCRSRHRSSSRCEALQRDDDVVDVSEVGFLEALDILGCLFGGREVAPRNTPSSQSSMGQHIRLCHRKHRRPHVAQAEQRDGIQPRRTTPCRPRAPAARRGKRSRNSMNSCRGMRPSQVRKVAAPSRESRTRLVDLQIDDRIEQAATSPSKTPATICRQRLGRRVAQQVVHFVRRPPQDAQQRLEGKGIATCHR